MGVLFSPLLRVPPKLPHRKYFRRGPRPFPPAGPHGFRGHLTRLTLCVAIAIPSVRRDAIGAARSNRWTFGSGMRASEDGASAAPPCYAACNAPASRSDGALLAHCTSDPTRLTLRVTIAIPSVRHSAISYGVPAGKISDFSRGARGAALKRASPCERLVSGSTSKEITSCRGTSRSEFSLFRLRKRDIVLWVAPIFFIIKVRRALRHCPQHSAPYYIKLGVRGGYPRRGQGAAPLGHSPRGVRGIPAEAALRRKGQGAKPLLLQLDHDDAVGGDAGDDLTLLEGGVADDDAHRLSYDAYRCGTFRARRRNVVVPIQFSDI